MKIFFFFFLNRQTLYKVENWYLEKLKNNEAKKFVYCIKSLRFIFAISNCLLFDLSGNRK